MVAASPTFSDEFYQVHDETTRASICCRLELRTESLDAEDAIECEELNGMAKVSVFSALDLGIPY